MSFWALAEGLLTSFRHISRLSSLARRNQKHGNSFDGVLTGCIFAMISFLSDLTMNLMQVYSPYW